MTNAAPRITTDLFLLLFRDDGRRESMGQMSNYDLAGGLLTDLTVAGRVRASDDGKRIHVVDPTPTGDPLLDEALQRFVAQDGKRVGSVVQRASKQLDTEAVAGAVAGAVTAMTTAITTAALVSTIIVSN